MENKTIESKKEDTSDVKIENVKDAKIEEYESLLQKMLDRDKERDDRDKKRDEEIKRLTSAADKGRLQTYDQKKGGKLIHTANVSTYNHKGTYRIVLGWETITDEVYFDPDTKKLVENQISKYIFDMGEGKKPETKEIHQAVFQRLKKVKKGDIIKESKTDEGEYRTLKFNDGREIELLTTFLN